jgi:exopolysaccharide biosynthesis operon protein EpsL
MRNVSAGTGISMLLATAACSTAFAAPEVPREPGDPFRVQLSHAMTRDSNLYRLPDDIDAKALSPDGNATRDDLVSRTSVAADGAWQMGKQELALIANVDTNRYSDNDSLDNTSGNGRADWNWQLGGDWAGQLGGGYGRSLSGFANSRFLGRDVLESFDYHGAARYQLTPHWSLVGKAKLAEGSHDTDARRQDDFESRAGTFGVDYLTRRGDQLGLEYRRTSTEFPNETGGNPLFASRRYIDRNANFNLRYAFTVKTSLQGSVGYVWRHYPEGVIGDFAGATWNASLQWEPRAKTRITIGQWQELKAWLDAESSHFESRGTRVTVAWLPTSRISLAFDLSDQRHDYSGFDPAAFTQPARRDTLRSAQTSFTWTPKPRFALDLAWGLERRESTRPLFDFDDRVVSAALRVIF